MALLNTGDPFPALSVTVPGGETLTLPDALAGSYGVVLVYRGAFCPYCNAQLRAFQRAHERLEELGVRVVALSVDDEETTRDLVEKGGIEFPVGYGADAAEVAAATGAFRNADPVHLQSTGFVLDPEGRTVVAVYSTGAIGRLVPEDVIGLVRHRRQRETAQA
ncbi:MAG TPA: peroxiredoxin family protein [Conexibacter sp.]|jgi:peroxiredoxin